MKMTVQSMAEMINDMCAEGTYLWAYRLVKETVELWKTETYKAYLCDDAKIMVNQALEVLECK